MRSTSSVRLTSEDPVKAIVFDFDGVLVESLAAKELGFRAIFADKQEILESVLAYHRRNTGASRYDKIRWAYERLLEEVLEPEQLRCLAAEFSAAVEEEVVRAPAVPGANRLLSSLPRTVPLFVVSATPADELERIVHKRGWTEAFRGIYGAPVPKTTHLRRIVGEYDWRPSDVAMIGDSMPDLEAAQSVGARFVGRVARNAMNPFPGDVLIIEDLVPLAEILMLAQEANG